MDNISQILIEFLKSFENYSDKKIPSLEEIEIGKIFKKQDQFKLLQEKLNQYKKEKINKTEVKNKDFLPDTSILNEYFKKFSERYYLKKEQIRKLLEANNSYKDIVYQVIGSDMSFEVTIIKERLKNKDLYHVVEIHPSLSYTDTKEGLLRLLFTILSSYDITDIRICGGAHPEEYNELTSSLIKLLKDFQISLNSLNKK